MNNLLNAADTIIDTAILISLIALSISLFLLLYRIIAGPTNADRAVALDAVGMVLMGIAAIFAIMLVTTTLNDVILLIGILLFIGTIGIAKFLEKGVIIDRNLD